MINSDKLTNKHIVIGVSGGIAAYKTPMLIRLFRKAGAEVRVVTTQNAMQFLTPVVIETLSGNKVYNDVFAPSNDRSTEHISLHDWADLMVIAPATANIIGKMASGIADDALSTTFLAMTAPVLIAPAMNMNMLAHPIVQRNLKTLNEYPNCQVLPTDDGFLACGAIGQGRMLEPEQIYHSALAALTKQDLQGKNVLITGGPTREKIDPVRFISNFSSGKMSIALAEECAARGANVTLVLGPTELEPDILPMHPIRIIKVESAQEMLSAAEKEFPKSNITILCAAVADYRPTHYEDKKIKRHTDDICIPLSPNPDISAILGANKQNEQIVVGFALETDHEEKNAEEKMKRKNLDFIVLNSLQDAGAGFQTDTNKVTIIGSKNLQKTELPLQSKQAIATQIINIITEQ